MLHPRKIDDSNIHVVTMPDGRVFVDVHPEYNRQGELVGRGGPEHSRHFHRFQNYGLADGVLRCHKCCLVKQGEEVLKLIEIEDGLSPNGI